MPPLLFEENMNNMNEIMQHLLLAVEFGYKSAESGKSLDETVQQFIFICNAEEQ